jgi:hypothetical protein
VTLKTTKRLFSFQCPRIIAERRRRALDERQKKKRRLKESDLKLILRE